MTLLPIPEFKPCPFCGSYEIACDKSEYFKDRWWVICRSCGASLTNGHLNRDSLVALWNRRSNPDGTPVL